MSVSNLEIGLSVTFIVFLIVLAGELIYVLRRRLSFRRHSSAAAPPPPIYSGGETPEFFTADAPSKELLYFSCLKPHTRVELNPSGPPNKNINGSSQDEEVIDVFKLLEANGPSRFLCTIKEDDREDVESTHDVDFLNKLTTKKVAQVEEELCVMVDDDDGNTKTVFSTPCDSPLFFTPTGSPSRDFMMSEFVVCVHEAKNKDDK